VTLAFAAWLLGVAQRRRAGGGQVALAAGLGAILALVAVAGALWPKYEPAASVARAEGSVPSEAWSAERLAAARAEGRPFVNPVEAATLRWKS
jgi:thiol:disulfide interchange protein